jgi:hypothetical protein
LFLPTGFRNISPTNRCAFCSSDSPASLSFSHARANPTGDQSHPEQLTPDGPLDSSHDKLPLDIPLAVCAASRAHWQIQTNTSLVISDKPFSSFKEHINYTSIVTSDPNGP